MNLPTKSLAAAVSLALMSVSAHAQLAAPTIGTTVPGTGTGLFLAVWDSAGTNSEIVNLSYDYAEIAAAGNLTPNSATSPFTTALNPSTGTGNVAQLNFGVIPGFSSLFASKIATTDFLVVSSLQGGPGTEAFAATSSTTPVTAYGGVGTVNINVQAELAAWAATPGAGGTLTDTTGTAIYSVQSPETLNGGQLVEGQQFGGAVGSSLGFYNITTTTAHKDTITQYANATGPGFWFLSTSGDLSYDVPLAGGTSPVPLPAAVWLLGSGLLGMAGIARRRRGSV